MNECLKEGRKEGRKEGMRGKWHMKTRERRRRRKEICNIRIKVRAEQAWKWRAQLSSIHPHIIFEIERGGGDKSIISYL
jgi:hypothetical protein